MSEQDSGGFDFNSLLEQAQNMQQQLAEAQASAAKLEVEGVSGGGVVKVRVNGAFEFSAVEIDPKVVDPDDVEMLADLVLAALHDAVAQLNQVQNQEMEGFDPGSIDLGALTGDGGLDLGALLGGADSIETGGEEVDD
jgi:DNA-binding YbaB/EbfC family protein